MSLAQRLTTVQPKRANLGCRTCEWLKTLTKTDLAAFNAWLADGKSAAQLWEVAVAEGLQISLTGFRHHMVHHRKAADDA